MPRLHNVFACLVHERMECVVDLVRNLRSLDPDSTVLLYNGGPNPSLLNSPTIARSGACVHPRPKRMAWGRLHEFAIDCLRTATTELAADTITIVDSDQLAIRAGYSALLERHLAGAHHVGLFGNMAHRQGPDTRIPPARTWFEEIDLWRPLLRSFADGEAKFLYWCFWPSTVFTAAAARELVRLWDRDATIRTRLDRSRVWATEEVLLPTLVALLGFEIARNPAVDTYVQYGRTYTDADLHNALNTSDAYWIHPVPRQYDHPLRAAVRRHHGGYARPDLATLRPVPDMPFPRLVRAGRTFDVMRQTEGWLADAEGELLLAAVLHVAAGSTQPRTVVEVGSYCGRSTVVLASVLQAVSPASRVWAIDPHDGQVGATDQGLQHYGPTFDRFVANLAAAGVSDTVEPVLKHSYDVHWHEPIDLLFVDGLHDYGNVSRDFRHFEPWIADGAIVLFHDYASYFPGVVAFVDELLAAGGYRRVDAAESLVALQKIPSVDRPPPRLLQPSRIFAAMRATPGWFDEAEGELLLSAALHAANAERDSCNIVEIGSYCGRSTIVMAGAVHAVAPAARVWAVDPHEGEVGAADQRLHTGEPTLDHFRNNLAAAGVAGVVETVVRRSYNVEWHRPIHVLLVDGLHYFANVSRDFLHFEPWIADGALILFHDYATYYPGVMAFVDHLLVQGSYRFLEQAGSLVLLQKLAIGPPRVAEPEITARTKNGSTAVLSEPPLVSCIMATADRPELVPKAIEYFSRQDYPSVELVIVDNGVRAIDEAIPDDGRIRYVRAPQRLTLAAAHNLACELASGDIICHWDDDDWMAPWRVSYQVQDLLRAEDETICGLSTLLFYEPMGRRAWRYQYPQNARPWLSGATFCYRKRFWEQHRFPDRSCGADTTLVWGLPASIVRAHTDTRFIVATVHRSNTSARRVNVRPFQPWPSEDVEALLGADLGFYLRWPRA